jgi:hypothetical protein
MPVTALVTPGPDVTNATPTLCDVLDGLFLKATDDDFCARELHELPFGEGK